MINTMNHYLPIRIIEKKQYGEVFTPKELIEKMLDTLPENIFCNPNLKWLDPCSGIGNFMIVLYFRLLKSLELWEPEEEKRSNHIIQNMLYMMELNIENINICKNIFGSINIVEGDFLEIDIEKYFGIKFDIVLGNPPFQEINKNRKNKLYERILLKCLSMSPEYLLFITPDNLFSGGSKAYLKLLEGHVEIICFDKSIQTFFPKIQEYICYFLFKKQEPGQTLIIGNDGQSFECFLRKRPVNPVRNWSQDTEHLINTYLLDKRNNSVYNRGKPLNQYQISGQEEDALIYTPSKYLYTTNKKLAIGLGIKKIVIFAISPNLEFKTDFDGNYGLGPNTFYIPINNLDEGLKLEQWFNSDIYKKLALSSKTSRQFLKIKFLQHLHLEKIIHI